MIPRRIKFSEAKKESGKYPKLYGAVWKLLCLRDDEDKGRLQVIDYTEDDNGVPLYMLGTDDTAWISVEDKDTLEPWQVALIEAHPKFNGWHDKCPKCCSSVEHHAPSCTTTPSGSGPSSQDVEAQAEAHHEMLADLARGK